MDNQNIGELKQNLNSLKAHRHDFIKDETYEVCKICGKKRLFLEEVAEGLQRGLREDGKTYSVRENRMAYFMPDIWEKMYNALGSKKAKLTALMLLQTGARINEARNIRKIDIDFQRNTIRLVVTKTKAK